MSRRAVMMANKALGIALAIKQGAAASIAIDQVRCFCHKLVRIYVSSIKISGNIFSKTWHVESWPILADSTYSGHAEACKRHARAGRALDLLCKPKQRASSNSTFVQVFYSNCSVVNYKPGDSLNISSFIKIFQFWYSMIKKAFFANHVQSKFYTIIEPSSGASCRFWKCHRRNYYGLCLVVFSPPAYQINI